MYKKYCSEWNIEIPVTTNNREKFIRETPGISDDGIAKDIYSFICENQPANVTFPLSCSDISEIVKNAFDAHSLTIGNSLKLKVVVQNKDGAFIVKIKDNGDGFENKEKGKSFELNSMPYTYKSKGCGGCFGGAGMGLSQVLDKINIARGQFFFKNRKEMGASIYMKFSLNQIELNENYSTELSDQQSGYTC